MGGNVFSETMATPRMPPDVYREVRDAQYRALARLFNHVGSPIEAPDKLDHGDIDILVANPFTDVSTEDIATALQAKAIKAQKGSPTTHFAVSWPQTQTQTGNGYDTEDNCFSDASQTTNLLEGLVISGNTTTSGQIDRFIQVDIHICPNYDRMQWELFLHAHGDFWNMVGGIIRRFGLTVSNSGCHIRIKELEGRYKKLARVKMTEKPREVLEYLGMDPNGFFSPFASSKDMMSYAATCRFHNPSHFADSSQYKSELPANDRQRVRKRQTFAQWIEDYLPAHQTNTPGKDCDLTREDVIKDAKNYFGKEFADEFEARKREGVRTIGIENLWAGLRKEVPTEGIELGYVMKGLKREIVLDEDCDEKNLSDVQRAYLDGHFVKVKEWAMRNCEEVGVRQKQVDREYCREKLLEKLEKEKEEVEQK